MWWALGAGWRTGLCCVQQRRELAKKARESNNNSAGGAMRACASRHEGRPFTAPGLQRSCSAAFRPTLHCLAEQQSCLCLPHGPRQALCCWTWGLPLFLAACPAYSELSLQRVPAGLSRKQAVLSPRCSEAGAAAARICRATLQPHGLLLGPGWRTHSHLSTLPSS